MRNAHWRLGWIAVTATAACGGDLLGAPQDAGGDVPVAPAMDASSPLDAGLVETSTPDGPAVQDGPGVDVGPVCGTESWSTVFGSFLDAGAPLNYVFYRRVDFLYFVRDLAVSYDAVDSQGNLLCPTYQVATCTYDPMQPRTSPQDVQHSNALQEFVGPDGRPYVWSYYKPFNDWFLVDGTRNPEGYQLLVDFNAGCSPNCACDAG
jgi:hypothetical protein